MINDEYQISIGDVFTDQTSNTLNAYLYRKAIFLLENYVKALSVNKNVDFEVCFIDKYFFGDDNEKVLLFFIEDMKIMVKSDRNIWPVFLEVSEYLNGIEHHNATQHVHYSPFVTNGENEEIAMAFALAESVINLYIYSEDVPIQPA